MSSFPPATRSCVDLVHQQLLSPRPRLPSSSSTRQKLWLRNIATARREYGKTLVVDTIPTTNGSRSCLRRAQHRWAWIWGFLAPGDIAHGHAIFSSTNFHNLERIEGAAATPLRGGAASSCILDSRAVDISNVPAWRGWVWR